MYDKKDIEIARLQLIISNAKIENRKLQLLSEFNVITKQGDYCDSAGRLRKLTEFIDNEGKVTYVDQYDIH